MKKLLLLVMAVVLVGCGKSKQLTELELKLDDAVERINVLEEANRPTPHRVDPTTGLPIGGGATPRPIGGKGIPSGVVPGGGGINHTNEGLHFIDLNQDGIDDTTGLPIRGTPPVQPKK